MLTETLRCRKHLHPFSPEIPVLAAVVPVPMMPAPADLTMPAAADLTVLAGVAAGVVIVLQHLHGHRHELPEPAPAEVTMPAAAADLTQLFHSQVEAGIPMDSW